MEGRLLRLGSARSRPRQIGCCRKFTIWWSASAAISTGPRVMQKGSTRHRQAEDFNAFGQRVDGRDHAMRDLVWAAVVNWYRECPIKPSEAKAKPACGSLGGLRA
jgi:hypothetical protein